MKLGAVAAHTGALVDPSELSDKTRGGIQADLGALVIGVFA